jgi:acyl-CoA-binding protein
MNDKEKLLKDSWTIDLKDAEPSEDDFCCGCEDGNLIYELIKCKQCDKNAVTFITNSEETVGFCSDHNGLGNVDAKFVWRSSANVRFAEEPSEEELKNNYITYDDPSAGDNPNKKVPFIFSSEEEYEMWKKLNRYEAGQERKTNKDKQ